MDSNAGQPVTYVPRHDSGTLLAPQGSRTQALIGFDDDYIDIVDYIIRCTHRIWEQRRIDLIHSHYAADCVVHTLAGRIQGVASVVEGTLATLASFPDRTLFGDHVIWAHDAVDDSYFTSHRITSHMTHRGHGELGAPTGRRATIRTIADCRIRRNRIFEEWLVRDNMSLVLQLGLNPWQIAEEQLRRTPGTDTRSEWLALECERTTTTAKVIPTAPIRDPAHPAQSLASAVFGHAVNARALAVIHDLYAPGCLMHGPSGRELVGCDEVIGFIVWLLGAFPDALISIDRVTSLCDPHAPGVTDIAVRWSLTGTHSGYSLGISPTGRRAWLLAVSHWRVVDGMIIEDWTVFDELALLRQLL